MHDMNSIIIKERYLTPLGYFNNIIIENEPALRLVLTGKCNLACEFCIYKKSNFNSAEVESIDLVDMTPSYELELLLRNMKDRFNYHIVHLTGGEPTLCKSIIPIASMIKKIGLKVNMVSNIVNIDMILELLRNNLLDELTFSYIPSDLDGDTRNESLGGYKTVDESRNEEIRRNILSIRKLYPDLVLKTNVITSGLLDINSAISFINWCWNNNISTRLQRDRYSNRIEGSTEAVKQILLKLHMIPQSITIRVPGATEICELADHNGNKIKLKIFNQNFRFDNVCNQCERIYDCDKALSSIRVFSKNGKPRLSLCTKLDKDFTTFEIKSFMESKISPELYYYKKYPLKYFEKFCTITNHQ